jgi:cytochrome c oxidase subunit 1
MLYFVFGVWSWIVGISLRILILIELGQPGSLIGDEQIYTVIVKDHAFIIFFIVITIIISGFGNWFLTLILGAPDTPCLLWIPSPNFSPVCYDAGSLERFSPIVCQGSIPS